MTKAGPHEEDFLRIVDSEGAHELIHTAAKAMATTALEVLLGADISQKVKSVSPRKAEWRRIMKKLLAVLLAGTMALSLAACGGGKTTAGTATKALADTTVAGTENAAAEGKGRRGYGTDRPS